MNQEAIELFENSRMAGNTHLLPNVSYYAVNPEKFDQALDLLKQQPPAGELTKWLRQIFGDYGQVKGHTKVLEACDRLDQAEAELKDIKLELSCPETMECAQKKEIEVMV